MYTTGETYKPNFVTCIISLLNNPSIWNM